MSSRSRENIVDYVKNRYQDIIFLAFTGSRAYNLQTKDSDLDLIGVYIPSRNNYLGISKYSETMSLKIDDYDIRIHDIRKFHRLLLKGAIDVTESLVPNKSLLYDTYNLHDAHITSFINGNLYRAYRGLALYRMDKLRKLPVESFEYNGKEMCYVMRALVMCKEMLTTKTLNPYRAKDRDYFMSFKNMHYSAGEILNMAEELLNSIDKLALKSDIPGIELSINYVNVTCMGIISQYWGYNE